LIRISYDTIEKLSRANFDQILISLIRYHQFETAYELSAFRQISFFDFYQEHFSSDIDIFIIAKTFQLPS
jgi:hypothetical protein